MKRRVLLSCVLGGAVFIGGGVAQAFPPSLPSGVQTGPVGVLAVNANAQSDEIALAAETFVAKMTSDGIGFLADSALSAEAQKAELRKLLNHNFDMSTIARFSLGRYWRSASEAQRQEYMRLFNAMILDVYSARFSEYQGQQIEVVGSRREGERDILVHSLLKQEGGGPDVKLDWRVRSRDGRYKVIDVIVEGVSMALTQRSDFSSVVQRGGGDMEALLTHLRQH